MSILFSITITFIIHLTLNSILAFILYTGGWYCLFSLREKREILFLIG